jgi:hypothetical protein
MHALGKPRSDRPAALSFGDKEAENQWYRTGKDTARWKPGDSTGDQKDDERLLWSSWKLDPPQLCVLEGSLYADCTLVRLVLSHLGFPFVLRIIDEEDAADDMGEAIPYIEGPGLPPVDVLCGTMEIISYAASVVREGRLAPGTNREDVLAWLDMVDEFVLETDECVPELATGLAHQLCPMLRGVDAEGVATVNQWGFCMDDAMVVASLHSLAGLEGSGKGAPESWPESVRDFLEVNLARAGVLSADSVSS